MASTRTRVAAAFSIERVVVILTPLFMALGGYISTEVATLTNVRIPGSDFTAIFVAGALGALAGALKWLHGRQKFVAFTDKSAQMLADAVARIRAELAANAPAQAAVDDIGSLLKSHEQSILAAFDQHVPTVVGQVVANLLSGAASKVAVAPPPQAPPPPEADAAIHVGGGTVPQ